MPRKKKTEPSSFQSEVTLDEIFGVKNSINASIDKEFNRIWGYLEKKKDESNRVEELSRTIDDLNKKIDGLQKSSDSFNAGNEETKSPKEICKELLNSVELGNLIKSEIGKALEHKNSVTISCDGITGDHIRVELGYSKTGEVVFFKKAFKNILWRMSKGMTLVTNTGFVSLENLFWIVIGED